jgi:heavy metal translocating P-type ATPase
MVLSGSVNKENVLELKAVRLAADSKYEQIIKLVREAESERAPMVRLADRYSVWFTAITFVIALIAWLVSHDPIRLLSVLVVATPCPLILATPIAIISGLARSASRGIIIKSGGALETLAEVNAFIFDKTGTLTLGAPELTGVQSVLNSENEIIQIAASLDQLSAHILARSLVTATKQKNINLNFPANFKENFGEGVSGEVNGKKYLFGKLKFLENNGIVIAPEIKSNHEKLQNQGKIAVYLGSADTKKLLGSLLFADKIRPEMKTLFNYFKQQGLDKIVMLTGDKKNVADNIAKQLGLDDIHAEALPEDKVFEVKDHQKQFGKVAMVGDGINDAPALAAANVGIALGGHGSTASADTSDIVITVDNLERVGEAYKIAKRVLRIAKQGIFIGIGVSIILMIIASLGFIKPVYGALIQELLDVAVILNALRVNFEKV